MILNEVHRTVWFVVPMVDHLKDFEHSRVDEHFNRTMANAESDQKLYELSNAYEDLLIAQLRSIKEKLKALLVS